MSSCSICLDDFNKSTRKATTCAYCAAETCRCCLQAHLLQDTATDPTCPSCRAAWSKDFLNAELTVSFRNGPLKSHREKVLCDRERARLPETQDAAMAYKTALAAVTAGQTQIHALSESILALPEYVRKEDVLRRMQELQRAKKCFLPRKPDEPYVYAYTVEFILLSTEFRAAAHAYKRASALLVRRRSAIKFGLGPMAAIVRSYGRVVPAAAGAAGAAAASEAVERRAFIKKCPADSCAGFLSTRYKCGICELQVCKDCEMPEGGEDHVCDPTIVESVKMLRKEARPCPKCAARISKIDGCDQMWCTQCKTAFSWTTGKIETAIIHNPHYFQWMRENSRAIPANPMACDNNLDRVNFRIAFLINASGNDATNARLTHLRNWNWRIMELRHTLGRHQQHMRNIELDDWRHTLRVDRLLNTIDDDAWKNALQRKEKDYNKTRTRVQLLDMFINAGMDILSILLEENPDIDNVVSQFKSMYEFTEKSNTATSKAYGCASIQLSGIRALPFS